MPEVRPKQLILRPSRGKHLALFLFSCAFTVGGVFMIRDEQGWAGWFVVATFGLGACVFAVQMLPGASWLQLTSEGFRFCTLFRKSAFVPWTSVSAFSVAKLPDSTLVGFSTEQGSKSRLAPVNVALAGVTEALPDTYGCSAENLAAILNEWRDRALEQPPAESSA